MRFIAVPVPCSRILMVWRWRSSPARRRPRRPSRCAASCRRTARAPAGSSATPRPARVPSRSRRSRRPTRSATARRSTCRTSPATSASPAAAARRSRSTRPSARAIAIRSRPGALLEALRVDVNNFNGRVEVRTIYPRRGSFGNNISASVDYVIAVPAGASVSLKSISGDISVTNVQRRSARRDRQRRRQHQRARRTSPSPRPSPAT